jgi:ribokinase
VLPDVIAVGLRAAEAAGVRVILNLAPFQPLAPDLLAVCDPLVVNEAEASSLVGWRVHDAATAGRAVAQLRGVVRSVIVTIGAEGAYWGDESGSGHVPAPIVVNVVDTTGAGDAFVGAVAATLARGASLPVAVSVGVRAGSHAVGSPGAQSSYATLADLELDDSPVDV